MFAGVHAENGMTGRHSFSFENIVYAEEFIEKKRLLWYDIEAFV